MVDLNKGVQDLTDKELISIYYAAFQPSMVKKGIYKAAFRRAALKVSNERRIRRRKSIFDAGAKAGRSSIKYPKPKFEGRDLGSMESMTFYDGVKSTRKDFKNPYHSPMLERG